MMTDPEENTSATQEARREEALNLAAAALADVRQEIRQNGPRVAERAVRGVRVLMTADDVADVLQVSVKTVYQWRSRRPAYGPPAIKVGKYLRWKPEVVQAWIDAQQ